MKKKMKLIEIITLAAAIGLLIAGCGSSPQTGPDELDAKIREASDYLNTRIPGGNKVAFINISGGYPDLADYILSDLSRHGVNDGLFSVVDRALLDQVRAELNFNMSGEVDENSAQTIGKMLGAQTIVSGSVRKLGNLYRLEVKAIEVQTASVQGQQIWNIADGKTIAALTVNTSSGGTASASGGRSQTTTASGGQAASGGQTAQAAAPAAIANGTYIFFPRPRASMNAIPMDNVFLDKIIVRGRNMLLYVTNTPRGPANGGPQGFNTAAGFECLITNLDRPSQSWKQIGERYSDGEGVIVSYENVTASRISIENKYWNGTIIWDEIKLADAEYEP